MPESIAKTSLANGIELRRVIVGLWQMADQERDGRELDLDSAAHTLAGYARSGFDTFDMADHYGSAELVAGRAARILRSEGCPPPVILTKWCPQPGPMDAGTVRKGVERALTRLELDRVDLMQFHWWRYEDPRYIEALQHLENLRGEGLIGGIGLTNFDAQHLRMVVKNGIPVVSNQVSFSLLDRRAADELGSVCEEHKVGLLGYGTLGGGFFSERWLGREEPGNIADWSRMKYKRFIKEAGGWPRFQGLMSVIAEIAAKHGVTVSNVATRWVLQQNAVAAVIVGVRLGENDHRTDNTQLMSFSLDHEDMHGLNEAAGKLGQIPGDCGDEYRKPPFLTASGDLSHHLDAMPPIYPARKQGARHVTDTGSRWEEEAGFSRALRLGNRIVVSGTTATDPRGEPVCPGDAAGQAVFILDKIAAAIEPLGATLADIVRTRIYLKDRDDWQAVSRVHKRYFAGVLPANTLVQAGLIGPYLVEIEAEAILES